MFHWFFFKCRYFKCRLLYLHRPHHGHGCWFEVLLNLNAIYFGLKQTNLVGNSSRISPWKMSWDFKSQMLGKIKCTRTELWWIQCVVGFVLWTADMFTCKLEFRIARGMVKNRLCQGSFLSPSGYRVAGYIIILYRSLLWNFL